MAETSNLHLTLTENPDTLFEAWRLGIDGNNTSDNKSDMQKIDEWAGEIENNVSGKQSQHSTTTASLTVAGWSNSEQVVNATGVTVTDTVIVAPDSTSYDDYCNSGIRCVSQGNGTLTFKCTDTPTEAITVNIVILTEAQS